MKILQITLTLIIVLLSVSVHSQPTQDWIASGTMGMNQKTAIDNDGNSVSLALAFTSPAENMMLAKYNSNGTEAWKKFYGGTDKAIGYGFVIDSQNNIYVAAERQLTGSSVNYVLLKYSPAGDTLWSRIYSSPGNHIDAAYAIAMDKDGNICVTGVANDSALNRDVILTMKYSQSGVLQWMSKYTDNEAVSITSYDITTDLSGNIIVTGSLTGNRSATVKYDNNGNQQWANIRNGSRPLIIETDSDGSVLLAVRFGVTFSDFLTIKYNCFGFCNVGKNARAFQ